MASITRKQTPKGVRHVARWRTPDGRSREQWFERKVDADRHLATSRQRKHLAPLSTPPPAGSSSARMRMRGRRGSRIVAAPRRASGRSSIRMWFRRSVTGRWPRSDRAKCRRGYQDSSSHRPRSGLCTASSPTSCDLRSAVDDRLIAHSPCGRQIRLPRAHGGEVVPMDPREVRAIVDADPPHYRSLLVLIAGTGLRPREALGLTSNRVTGCAARSASTASSSRCRARGRCSGRAKRRRAFEPFRCPTACLSSSAGTSSDSRLSTSESSQGCCSATRRATRSGATP